MPITFDQAVAQLRGAQAAGFDVSPEQGALLMNEGIRRFAARSQWIKAELEVGPTVAAQSDYDVPAQVAKLFTIWVSGFEYKLIGISQLKRFQNGRESMPLAWDGAFAEKFDSTGAVPLVSIFGAPDTDGLAMTGLAAITPLADLSGTDILPFPDDKWRGALFAAKAIAYEDIDENPQQADYNWQRFGQEAQELKMRSNSRVGSGPIQIGLARP